MYIAKMTGEEHIKKTREYLDYLEEHLSNVQKAFQEVSDKCTDMDWVKNDMVWHDVRSDVQNHDLSKFSTEEFTQYRNSFFPMENEVKDITGFEMAWDNHKQKNHHHWETIEEGIDIEKDPNLVELNIVHMIMDWTAMSYKFGDSAQQYYEENKKTVKIHSRWHPFMYEIFNRLAK